MFKVDKKGMFQECYLGAFMSLAWSIFLKTVTESDFLKSSGLYIDNSERVCNAA